MSDTPKMVLFRNVATDRHFRMVVGRRPGQPPYVFEAPPGGFFEGPVGYADVFARESSNTVRLAEDDEPARVALDGARDAEEKAQAKARAEAEARAKAEAEKAEAERVAAEKAAAKAPAPADPALTDAVADALAATNEPPGVVIGAESAKPKKGR